MNKDTRKFQLKEGYRFYLYINISPCGDVRQSEIEGLNRSDGQLQAKIEGLWIRKTKNWKQDTWDRIVSGKSRLITHSCSDKLAKWNMLGIQGALLSQLIRPIYLQGIDIGQRMHISSLERAKCSRYGKFDLPKEYRINKPNLCCPSNAAAHQFISKSGVISLAWSKGGEG